jgi:hypothetical protein
MTDAVQSNSCMALTDLKYNRTTAKRPLERFFATAVPVEVLERLGNLLTDIANIKKSETAKPALITALRDNSTVPVGHPAVKADRLPSSVEMVA